MIGKPVALIQVPNQRGFRVKAAARYLGISPDLLYEITAAGALTPRNLRGRRQYLLEDLDHFLEGLPVWKNGAGEKPVSANLKGVSMPKKERCITPKTSRADHKVFELSKTWPEDSGRFRRQFSTEKLAHNMKVRIENAINLGTWRELKKELDIRKKRKEDNNPTIEEFSKIYLDEYCRRHNNRPDFKETTVRQIVAIVGDIRVKDFSRSDAVRFKTERSKSVKNATVNRSLAVLSNLLKFAIDKELISVHPMVRFTKYKEEKRAIEVMMTLQQYHSGIAALLKEDITVGVCCAVMGETALRPGELRRLRWPLINVGQRMLTVDKTKTRDARSIPLSEFAVERLQMLPRLIGCEAVIIDLQTLKPIESLDTVRERFKELRAAAGLDRVELRDFRHFRISQWVMQGVNSKEVQVCAGHNNIHTTMKYYAEFDAKRAHQSFMEAQRREAASLAQTTAQVETKRRRR